MSRLSGNEREALLFIVRRQHEAPEGTAIKHDEITARFSAVSQRELRTAIEVLKHEGLVIGPEDTSPLGSYAIRLTTRGWRAAARDALGIDPGGDVGAVLDMVGSGDPERLVRGDEVVTAFAGDVVRAVMVVAAMEQAGLLGVTGIGGSLANSVLRLTTEGRMHMRRTQDDSSVPPATSAAPHNPTGGSAKPTRKAKAPDGFALASGALVGRWRLTKPLGVGGQGEVWQVQHACERHVPSRAMKICLAPGEKARARFEREVQLLKSIADENVMPVVEANLEWTVTGSDGIEAAWFVMPIAKGSIDSDLWADNVPLLLRFFGEVCRGVQFLHEQDPVVLHRDLKPSNILILDEARRAVLADMGIAADEDSQGQLTATQEVVGTPRYRAPEVANGAPASIRSDVYGLGRVLERILTGLEPDGVESRMVPRGTLLRDDVATSLDAVISKAAAFDPSHRYESVRQLVEALPRLTLALAPTDEVTLPARASHSADGPVEDLSELGLPTPGDEIAWIRWGEEPDDFPVVWGDAPGPGFAFLHLAAATPLRGLTRLELGKLVDATDEPALRFLGPQRDFRRIPALGPRGGVVFDQLRYAKGVPQTANFVSFLDAAGTLLGVNSMMVDVGGGRWTLVSAVTLERDFVHALQNFVEFMSKRLGGALPYVATTGLVGTAGSYLELPGGMSRDLSGRTPEDPIAYRVTITSCSSSPINLLRPFFNHVWECYAEDRSRWRDAP